MRKSLADIKVIIGEVIGMIGGFFWAKASGWEYEPLILLCASTLGFIISLYLLFQKRKSVPEISVSENSNKVTSIAPDSKLNIISKETPETILSKIDSAPLFQMDDTASHFVGLIVSWQLKLFFIHKGNPPNINVSMVPLKGITPVISFETSTTNYPILKIAGLGMVFEVKGEIIKCTPRGIELNLIELSEK